ncbi:MAG TPA: O-antigen ligase family protein, partial [Solirubrobacteraceae bacterium]|nr:O-antigen ligase family protein [Solirubrobacteraceae bacterium]
MHRVRPIAAVLPALIPGACVLLLAFQAGGFFPSSWAALGFVAAVVLALRIVLVERPFAGFSAWSGVAAGALALFGIWILLSSGWSHAPGRALVEFGRLLTYLLILVICASLAPRESRLAWALRGLALAIGIICVAALITRLRPDIYSNPGSGFGRLDYPITYWNGLAMLAGVGAILGLHLSASDREPWPVRVLAAGLPAIAVVTVYLTLSRGGIFASIFGMAIYLVLGFSRATPGALLAIVPTSVYAFVHAYDADLLVDNDKFSSAAALAQGRDVWSVLLLSVGAAIAIRAVALLLDRGVAALPGPGRLPVPARVAAAAAVLIAVVVVALAAGAPAYADRQLDAFLNTTPEQTGSTDQRDRLTVFNNNGRVDHWNVALDSFRADELKGSGAGTFQNEWNRYRPAEFQVMDAHSLYIETLGEMGIVGIALLMTALLAIALGLIWRLRGPGRPAAAAVLAVFGTWALHAGVDWDWELTSVSVWMFGIAGIALASPVPEGARRPMPRLLRLVAALGVLVLAISPAAMWRSQTRLADAGRAFERGDCNTTIDAALDSLGAVGQRAEPWELIAYCDIRLGQPKLAIGAAEAAVRRDPD